MRTYQQTRPRTEHVAGDLRVNLHSQVHGAHIKLWYSEPSNGSHNSGFLSPRGGTPTHCHIIPHLQGQNPGRCYDMAPSDNNTLVTSIYRDLNVIQIKG